PGKNGVPVTVAVALAVCPAATWSATSRVAVASASGRSKAAVSPASDSKPTSTETAARSSASPAASTGSVTVRLPRVKYNTTSAVPWPTMSVPHGATPPTSAWQAGTRRGSPSYDQRDSDTRIIPPSPYHRYTWAVPASVAVRSTSPSPP